MRPTLPETLAHTLACVACPRRREILTRFFWAEQNLTALADRHPGRVLLVDCETGETQALTPSRK